MCVCIVNDLHSYTNDKDIVKNRADYTISNLTGIGYDVYEDKDIDKLLNTVADAEYESAVVISMGTEFINGNDFFDNHPAYFVLLGHILDGGDAYYGLHPQCFSINLINYNMMNRPVFGKSEPFVFHEQREPNRSTESIHDEYLPFWISQGKFIVNYKHKLPGWNLISATLKENFPIVSYEESVRNGKFFLYPEGNTTQYVYQKYNYCLTQHVHSSATGDAANYTRPDNIVNLITPANTHTAIQRGPAENVMFYDYNIAALESVGGGFHCDIINDPKKFVDFIPNTDQSQTVVDCSNIFCYEGTAGLYSLKYRVQQENLLIQLLKEKVPDATVLFDQRAAEGICTYSYISQKAKDLILTDYNSLDLPSWH